MVDSLKKTFKIATSARGAFRYVQCWVECASVKERDKGGSEFLHCEDLANISRK